MDTKSLSQMINNLREISKSASILKIASNNLDPKDAVEELENFVNKLVEQAPLQSIEDIALKIDFVGSHMLNDVLFCAVASNVSVDDIKKLVKEKLTVVREDTVNRIWNILLSEFDKQNRRHPMILDKGIISEDFFNNESIDKTRDKIADYIVEIKPKLLVSMFKTNVYQYPVEVPGGVRFIASNDPNNILPVDNWEVMLGRSITRLAFIWENGLYQDIETIINILRITKSGRLLCGPDYKDMEKQYTLGNQSKLINMLFLELRKILNITDSIISGEKPIEKSLWQYKQGLEVMTPEIIKEIEKKKELLLQKELCKFLIERDIFAVGTRFGRSQTDLLVGDSTLVYIIETKVYKKRNTLNENSIRGDIAQLQSYMDQYQIKHKGILVIYNMTDWLVETPNQWINQNLWILPINLQDKPPSDRDKTVTVEESSEENLIRVIRNEKKKRS